MSKNAEMVISNFINAKEISHAEMESGLGQRSTTLNTATKVLLTQKGASIVR